MQLGGRLEVFETCEVCWTECVAEEKIQPRRSYFLKRRYVISASPLYGRPGSGWSAGRRVWMGERLAVEIGPCRQGRVHHDGTGRRGAGARTRPSGKRFARWRRRRERYDGASCEACLTRVSAVNRASRAAHRTRIADRNFQSEAAGRCTTAAATAGFDGRVEQRTDTAGSVYRDRAIAGAGTCAGPTRKCAVAVGLRGKRHRRAGAVGRRAFVAACDELVG